MVEVGRQHSWYHGSKPDILVMSSQQLFAPTLWLSGLQHLSVCRVWLDRRGRSGWLETGGEQAVTGIALVAVGRAEKLD